MQYCFLQHWTLHSQPGTSITECCSCSGPASSLFLELLVIALHSSLVGYWTPSDLGSSSSLFAFLYYSCGSCINNIILRGLPSLPPPHQWTTVHSFVLTVYPKAILWQFFCVTSCGLLDLFPKQGLDPCSGVES